MTLIPFGEQMRDFAKRGLSHATKRSIMTRCEASTHAQKLWGKWVSSKPYFSDGNPDNYVAYDLDRIHASMLQEYRWTLKNPARMTAACFSEIKGELILLGKVRKALSNN